MFFYCVIDISISNLTLVLDNMAIAKCNKIVLLFHILGLISYCYSWMLDVVIHVLTHRWSIILLFMDVGCSYTCTHSQMVYHIVIHGCWM